MGLAFRPPQTGQVGQLVLCCPGLSGNKKVPPKTMLMQVRDGRVATSQNGGVKWSFSKTKAATVVEKAADGKLTPQMPLQEYMKKSGAVGIVRHSTFTGAVPAELTPPSDLEFIPAEASIVELLKFCMSRSDLSLVWQVQLNKEKVVIPKAIVIFTKKQMIVPAAGRFTIM